MNPKTGTMRGWPIAGLLACDLYLVLGCTCFRHQSEHLHLFFKNISLHYHQVQYAYLVLVNYYTWYALDYNNNILVMYQKKVYILNLIQKKVHIKTK